MSCLRWFYFFSAFFVTWSSHAQQVVKSVSGDFSHATFQRFVQSVESKTNFHFYYNNTLLDTMKIDFVINERPLDEALAKIFDHSDFHFATDSQFRVYITSDIEIQTELPPGFFVNNFNLENESDPVAENYFTKRQKEKLEESIEDKLFVLGSKIVSGKNNPVIAGHVRDVESGEAIVGAVVFVENPWKGTATDQFGFYSLSLPRGRYELKIKSLGMKNTKRQAMVYSDGKLDVEMQQDVVSLREVVIESEKDVNVTGLQMGQGKLDIKTIKQIPSALGEVDILRSVLTLPGVQSVGEGTVGLNVRGGATSQNLILFNDATIYNPSHLFGFFSAFNPDILKNVELYKSGIPAEFGGRLSSVLEVNTRDGNKKKFSGSGGISPITGRLALEGPVIKDKTSFILAARSTYSDWLLNQIPNQNISKSKASFYDINAGITHEINDKNSIRISYYFSKDQFRLGNDTTYSYSNQNASVKWKHIFSNKLYGVATGGFSSYEYSIASDKNPVNAFTLAYRIAQTNLKADFSYFITPQHTINFGASSIYYQLQPGSLVPNGTKSLITPDQVQSEQGSENAVYVSDRFEVNPRLSIYYGIRYSLYSFLGPKSVLNYSQGSTRDVSSIVDTINYKSGKNIATYQGPEYRLSARYGLPGNASLKFSYNRMRQYIQMLSNTTAISPTDIWKLSDAYIKPQIGDQVSLGYYKNLKSNTIEFSAEAYYKTTQNFLDYKSGATLLLNHHIETDVVNALGHAYGVEFMVRKSVGKLNGWISYTYARSLVQAKSPYASETINDGKFYPSNYDKPHSLNVISNYKFNRRFSISLNYTYSTGRPITLPLAKYESDGVMRLFYSQRNQYRIPDYWRADISLNIEGNHKIRKLAHSSWTIAVYNLTGRQNAYSVYFVSESGVIKGYKLSIFGNAIPTITYNFRF